MSENSTYQQLRGHLAYLRLAAAAEALPGRARPRRRRAKLGHTAFLERLLAVEVAATEARRHASLARFASLPAPWRLDRLRLRRPTVGRPQARRRARHPALRRGRHQRAVHRPARRRQDDARRRPRPRRRRRRLPHLLHHRRRARRPLPPRRPRRAAGRPPCASTPDPACWSSTYADPETMPTPAGRVSRRSLALVGFAVRLLVVVGIITGLRGMRAAGRVGGIGLAARGRCCPCEGAFFDGQGRRGGRRWWIGCRRGRARGR